MTKLKSLMLTGAVAVLSVSGIACLTASANSDNTPEKTTEFIEITTTEAKDDNKDDSKDNDRDYKVYTFDFGDEDLKDFQITLKNDLKLDYSKLTEEEKEELLAIYDRIEAIFAEVFPEDLSDITDDEMEARLEKYEDELDKLSKRSSELEKKAGWDDGDAVISFITNIDNEDLINKTSAFIENITEEGIEKIADEILDEIKNISEEDIDKFVDDVRVEINNISDEDIEEILDEIKDDFDEITDDDIDKFVDEIKDDLEDISEDDIRNITDKVIDGIESITSDDIKNFANELLDELDEVTDEDIEKFVDELLGGFGIEED